MKGKKVDVIDAAINDARRLVDFKELCDKLSSYSQSSQTVMSLQPNFNIFQFNEALNIQALNISNSRRPFGFRIYTCERCLESPIDPVFYPDMDQGMNQAIHRCRPERLAAIGSVFDKWKHVLPLQLSNGEIPAFSMVFWHSKEAHIELDMDREHQDNNDIILNHWVSRAITQGLTQLTDKEVSEFLQLVRTATFAFKSQECVCYV
jgi:hypothetical protein